MDDICGSILLRVRHFRDSSIFSTSILFDKCSLYSVRRLYDIFAFSGGARVDLVDQDGHSLLHWAALGGNADVCQILIENKINPNVQDYAGRTPLQCAAYGGYINCMAVLMENNADPNIQDKEVESLHLFYAVCSEVLRVFLLCS